MTALVSGCGGSFQNNAASGEAEAVRSAVSEPDVDAILSRAAKPPPLPPPEGAIVRVRDASGLANAIAHAEPHSTILVADGTYHMPLRVTLRTSDVVLRGESGNRDAVILDGSTNHMDRDSAILFIKGAQRVLVADMTFRNSKKYGVMLYGDSGIAGFRAHNLKFHNIWARGLKGTTALYKDDDYRNRPYPPGVVKTSRPTNGEVRHCLFIADHIKTDRRDGFNGDYISGIDMMHLKNWTFADNVFIGLRGANGGGRGAIFIWVQSEDVLIERNVFVNNDRSICLGNPSYRGVSARRAVVRDNIIVSGVNKAVECWGTQDAEIANNRIYSTRLEYPLTVHFAGISDGAFCHHNIIHGHLVAKDSVRCEDNNVGRFDGAFKNPAVADLSLTRRGRRLFGLP